MRYLHNPSFGRGAFSRGGVSFTPSPGGGEAVAMPEVDAEAPGASQLRKDFWEAHRRVRAHVGSLPHQAENLERALGWARSSGLTLAVTVQGGEPVGVVFDGRPAVESALGWAWNTAWVLARSVREELGLVPGLPKDLADRWAALRDERAAADYAARGRQLGEPAPAATRVELVSRPDRLVREANELDASGVRRNFLRLSFLEEALALALREGDPVARLAALVRTQVQEQTKYRAKGVSVRAGCVTVECAYAATESGDVVFGDFVSVTVDIAAGFLVEASAPDVAGDEVVFIEWGARESARAVLAAIWEQFRAGKTWDKHVEEFAQAYWEGPDSSTRPKPPVVEDWLAGHPEQEWARRMSEGYLEAKVSGRLRLG